MRERKLDKARKSLKPIAIKNLQLCLKEGSHDSYCRCFYDLKMVNVYKDIEVAEVLNCHFTSVFTFKGTSIIKETSSIQRNVLH